MARFIGVVCGFFGAYIGSALLWQSASKTVFRFQTINVTGQLLAGIFVAILVLGIGKD